MGGVTQTDVEKYHSSASAVGDGITTTTNPDGGDPPMTEPPTTVTGTEKQPPPTEAAPTTDTILTRVPSVLPDAETSPRYSTAEDGGGGGDGVGCGRGDLESNNNNNNNNNPLALARTTTSTNQNPYYSLPLWRKSLIVLITSCTALSVTFSSTSMFPLTEEIAGTFDTTPQMIQTTNALFILAMGLAGFIWGPISRLVGRKNAWLAACAIFFATTIGMGVAPEGPMGFRIFLAMRILGGLEGTFFHIAGQTWLADVFEPTQRGTATGFFLIGTVFGPAFGASIGGIMVTYLSWRSVCYLQAAMMGVGFLASFSFLPDIRHPHELRQLSPNNNHNNDDNSLMKKTTSILGEFSPFPTLKLLLLPNVLFTDIACGFLAWSQYTILASPRHILNPRFHLTTPLVSGLFTIAPGVGFILGTVIGGRFSDMTVIKWIKLRSGLRLPQDRLNSGMISFFLIIPAASLIYGWGLHFEVGGLPLPIVFAFFEGMGLLMAFASLNTYCAEVLPRKRTQVIATKYLLQYICSATGSAVIVPLIDRIGMGPATTFSVALALLAGGLTFVTARYGLDMQRWVERNWWFGDWMAPPTTTTTTTTGNK